MIKYFFLFFAVLITASVFSKTDSLTVKYDDSKLVKKQFNKQELDAYKLDKSFDYSEEDILKEPSFFERLFNWLGRQFLRFLEWLFGVEDAQGVFATILSALPYIIVGIVLLLLLKFFLKMNIKAIAISEKNKPTIAITDEEKLIKNKGLLKLIEQVIQQKNYRLAVRYYYLNTLKQLEKKEFITWEQQKTNEDYIKEISEKNIQKIFKNLTHLYDFVWYGNFSINDVEFIKVQSDFENANNLITKKKIG